MGVRHENAAAAVGAHSARILEANRSVREGAVLIARAKCSDKAAVSAKHDNAMLASVAHNEVAVHVQRQAPHSRQSPRSAFRATEPTQKFAFGGEHLSSRKQ